jgi:hypothetical protein
VRALAAICLSPHVKVTEALYGRLVGYFQCM